MTRIVNPRSASMEVMRAGLDTLELRGEESILEPEDEQRLEATLFQMKLDDAHRSIQLSAAVGERLHTTSR